MYFIYGAQNSRNDVVFFHHTTYEGVVYYLENELELVKVPECTDVWCYPGVSAKSISAGYNHCKIVKISVYEGM